MGDGHQRTPSLTPLLFTWVCVTVKQPEVKNRTKQNENSLNIGGITTNSQKLYFPFQLSGKMEIKIEINIGAQGCTPRDWHSLWLLSDRDLC